MAHKQFQLSETNPNESTGTGGCICDEMKQTDCKPPYVVCYQNEMASVTSPHVVACRACIEEMYRLVSDENSEQAVVGNRGDSAENYRDPYEQANSQRVTPPGDLPQPPAHPSDEELVDRRHQAEQPPTISAEDDITL